MAMSALAKEVYRKKGKRGCYIDSRGFPHFYHSILERKRMKNLDLAGLRFVREPFRIKYTFEHRVRVYVVDLAVYDRSGLTLLRIEEVKPQKLLNDPQNIAKWRAARRWASARGCGFRVVTDSTLAKL